MGSVLPGYASFKACAMFAIRSDGCSRLTLYM
jgi:hypothetical protein